jgi:2-polyprenyl-6-methoxyphenol hydroxylase-like FAD-dependent oxidoreductase
MNPCEVLIVGAGPTGLVLALWLIKQGVQVRIIDRASGPGTTSRALAVQARTLELYRQLDLTEPVLEQGYQIPAINLWVKGRNEATISFEKIAEGLSPYGPFIFPQDEHERLLVKRLEELGTLVERDTQLLSFEEKPEAVSATFQKGEQPAETCEARYLIGSDGARSIVRQGLGIGFSGGTYQQLFYVADVEASGPALNGELHIDLDQSDFIIVFPLKGQNRARLVGMIREERSVSAESLRFEDVSDRAREQMKVTIDKVHWFSTYRVHHRVAEHFRKGRSFLLGDAAHIHSPAGGQGMNTGIGDAINLAWKLKAVLRGEAPEALLDTYEIERQAFARKLVSSTDKGFSLATAQGPVAEFIRTRIVPIVVPTLFHFERAREFMFSAVSQITITYRDSPISQGGTGHIHGGDRLPWVAASGIDNFEPLSYIGWQLHVYGNCSAPLSEWCASKHIPVRHYAWQAAHGSAGLVEDAIYLLRPDTYIALVSQSQDPAVLAQYFATHRILPAA